jgi:hypothetical protein
MCEMIMMMIMIIIIVILITMSDGIHSVIYVIQEIYFSFTNNEHGTETHHFAS